MPCFHPLEGFRSRHVNASGKRSIVFDISKSLFGRHSKVTLPCGQCVGCRLERSRQWAIRCMHEAQLHEQGLHARNVKPSGIVRVVIGGL